MLMDHELMDHELLWLMSLQWFLVDLIGKKTAFKSGHSVWKCPSSLYGNTRTQETMENSFDLLHLSKFAQN